MTIVSCASLAARGPQAPLPPFRSFRHDGRRPRAPTVPTASNPQRHLPRIALADDPPRGRILVVADQPALALQVQGILRAAGYRAVGPAGSATETERLIERPIHGAILDAQLGEASRVAVRLAHAGIPFVWLTGESTGALIGAPAVTKPIKGSDLITALERALSSESRFTRRRFYPVPPPQHL